MTGALPRASCNAPGGNPAGSGSVTVCGVAALLVAVMAQLSPSRRASTTPWSSASKGASMLPRRSTAWSRRILISATAAGIAFTRDAFFDLLKIRASSTLFPLAQR